MVLHIENVFHFARSSNAFSERKISEEVSERTHEVKTSLDRDRADCDLRVTNNGARLPAGTHFVMIKNQHILLLHLFLLEWRQF